jgi:SdpI/YfhL protein family
VLLVEVVLVASGVLFIALAVPLMRRAVPPNGWYGFRVTATLSDEALWYEVNARASGWLLATGIALVLGALAGRHLFALNDNVYVLVNLAILLGGVLVHVIAGFRIINRAKRA